MILGVDNMRVNPGYSGEVSVVHGDALVEIPTDPMEFAVSWAASKAAYSSGRLLNFNGILRDSKGKPASLR